jgi:protein dithiol:quinone oxidoreductase
MNRSITQARVLSGTACLFCTGVLSFGAYLQLVEGLEPCPLCISQRLVFLAVGFLFLAGALIKRVIRVTVWGALIMSLVGAFVSSRHVWLQHLPPDEVPECSPGIEYVFQHFPLSDTVKLMLTGTGECAKVDWTLLGLSIPAWALLTFASLVGLACLQLLMLSKIQ